MKGSFKFALIIFLITGCINAPRDNKYDPKNPDKAEIEGVVCEPDSLVMSNIIINLINRDMVIKVDTSDDHGIFNFDNIDPGIYKITASALHYSDFESGPESLWAGTIIVPYNIFFSTFHFEDDSVGSIPYGFNKVSGNWSVKQDSSQWHSLFNIYNGSDIDDDGCALTLFRSRSEYFDFGAKIKVLSSSGTNWEVGILLWYQDVRNYYFLRIRPAIITLNLMKDSLDTLIQRKDINFYTETWYYLKVIHFNNLIAFYLNDNILFSASLVNIIFRDGYWGMYVLCREPGGVASVNFDDVFIGRFEE